MKDDILNKFNISKEEILRELEINQNSHIIITKSFIYHINYKNNEALISSIKRSSFDGYNLSVKNKNSTQFYWSILGIICAVGFWQLSSDIIISAIGGIFITLISIFLAIDYWITPEKFLLKLFSGTDIISIKIHKEILGECREILSYLNENTIN